MTRQLENKTAFVTGGSRGIGREIAKRLAADGAVVGLTYNSSPEGADETLAAIEDAAEGPSLCMPTSLMRAPFRRSFRHSTSN